LESFLFSEPRIWLLKDGAFFTTKYSFLRSRADLHSQLSLLRASMPEFPEKCDLNNQSFASDLVYYRNTLRYFSKLFAPMDVEQPDKTSPPEFNPQPCKHLLVAL
jgi:hypothetical protein